MNNDFITTREAADILGLNPQTLHQWRSEYPDRLPFYKLGESKQAPVRYKRSEILAFMESCSSLNRNNS